MNKNKTYSECVDVELPLSDVQFLYGKIETLIKENEKLKNNIREQDEQLASRLNEIMNTLERCDYAYAFCYELQKVMTDIKDKLEHDTKKNTKDYIDTSEKRWEYLTEKYNSKFTYHYNSRKRNVDL